MTLFRVWVSLIDVLWGDLMYAYVCLGVETVRGACVASQRHLGLGVHGTSFRDVGTSCARML